MNSNKKELHEIKAWANVRQTSIEIAQAIFELANDDTVLADKIWEEGCDEVLTLAFTKTDADKLFWGEQTIERKNV